MIITSMLQLRNPFVFFTNDNWQLSKQISPDTVNTRGHPVDTLIGLSIDLIDNSDRANIIWLDMHTRQGIPQQPGTGQIASLIAFSPRLLCCQKWKRQSESKIRLVLHTGLAWSPLLYGLAWFISGTSYDFRSRSILHPCQLNVWDYRDFSSNVTDVRWYSWNKKHGRRMNG
jgi:hypothetical protein